MNLHFKKCTFDDLETLRIISYQTFYDTFSESNTPSSIDAYMDNAFQIKKLESELSNPHSAFYFLYNEDEIAGYVKLNEYEAQTDIHDPNSIEVERIYLLEDFQGKGLGKALIDKAIDVAHNVKKDYLWLGVWEKNEKAIAFYKRNGFFKIDQHSFFMGDEEQTDYIMRKDLK